MKTIILTAAMASLLPACTVVKVAKLPFQAAGKVVDVTTTSGEEADRNRGRELKKKCKEKKDDYYCK